ncbi:hypothetical protein ABGB12_00305 [Actinocorallia sp. B10E7]|uniref:hypothetical protein n=1 Tax=Actinocorallia sp. B10E7 TaxID=3153558 RepID=UPI00325C6862
MTEAERFVVDVNDISLRGFAAQAMRITDVSTDRLVAELAFLHFYRAAIAGDLEDSAIRESWRRIHEDSDQAEVWRLSAQGECLVRLAKESYRIALGQMHDTQGVLGAPGLSAPDLSKPDPSTAGSMHELADLLERYRVWSGEPSTREISRVLRSAKYPHPVSHTTIARILYRKDGTRPHLRLQYVRAIIIGCNGSVEDQELWVHAWRRLSGETNSG